MASRCLCAMKKELFTSLNRNQFDLRDYQYDHEESVERIPVLMNGHLFGVVWIQFDECDRCNQ